MGGREGGYHTEDLLGLVASVFLVSNAHVGNTCNSKVSLRYTYVPYS